MFHNFCIPVITIKFTGFTSFSGSKKCQEATRRSIHWSLPMIIPLPHERFDEQLSNFGITPFRQWYFSRISGGVCKVFNFAVRSVSVCVYLTVACAYAMYCDVILCHIVFFLCLYIYVCGVYIYTYCRSIYIYYVYVWCVLCIYIYVCVYTLHIYIHMCCACIIYIHIMCICDLYLFMSICMWVCVCVTRIVYVQTYVDVYTCYIYMLCICIYVCVLCVNVMFICSLYVVVVYM